MKIFKFLKYNLICLLIFVFCFYVQAHTPLGFNKGLIKTRFTPIQIGLFFNANLFDGFNPVYGFAFSLPFSPNREIYGISTGIIGGAEEHYGAQLNLVNVAFDIYGLQTGLMGIWGEHCTGIQINALWNNSQQVDGLQIGGVNFSEEFNGAQLGIYNKVYSYYDNKACYVNGMQIGGYNETQNLSGAQIGVVNIHLSGKKQTDKKELKEKSSFQFGIFNKAGECTLQIGLLNYNESGFLKYFPFFNFTIE